MFSISKPFRNFDLKNKKTLILLIFILILISIRALLPAVLLKKSNAYLSNFSPNYSLHIDDLDLSIIKGSYTFQGITGKVKKPEKAFLKINSINVSIAWREIFKGNILTDVIVNNAEFLVIKDINKLASPKKESKGIKDKFFPVKVERVDILNSTLVFEEYKSLTDESNLKVTNIDGRITNLTPNDKFPLSYFNLSANLVDMTSKFHFLGELNLLKKPVVWNLDAELRDFKLTSLNPYLKKHMPLTFTAGTLDMYSEAISKEGKIEGYVKPFFREIDVVANKEKFISAKHFGVEILTALINLILRESKTKSIATILDFNYDKKMTINKKKGVSKALEHDFKQQLSPGFENRYNLN